MKNNTNDITELLKRIKLLKDDNVLLARHLRRQKSENKILQAVNKALKEENKELIYENERLTILNDPVLRKL
jgi:hypothetical protein